jgi:hypothetical protein
MTRHYIAFNHYGSDTSTGFINSWSAAAFYSRTARDEYIRQWGHRDMSIRKCTRRVALGYAERLDRELLLRTFDGDYSVKPSDLVFYKV